jgi:colicin import membrane protein
VINFFIPSTDLPQRQWRISLSLAVVLHLLVFLLALFAPYLFQFRPALPEVHTVSLFSVEETRIPSLAPPAPPPAVITPSEAKIKKPVETKVVKTPPPPAAETRSPEAVSLKPIKSKSKNDQEQVKRLREKLLTQERAQKAEEEADRSARDALEKLKESLQLQKQATRTENAGSGQAVQSAPRSGSGVTVDENTRRYLLAVNNQIQEYWQIPLYQNWDQELEVRAELTVRRDGVVTRIDFVHKSNNVYFNQFVEKTIKNATPLPPFPLGVDQSQMEIGLRFTLKGLQ